MIPARLGSKRIKKKNIRLLNGTPLISYTIRAALQSKCFDEVWVNSESQLIGGIAMNEGASFYERHPVLSSDDATNDWFVHDFLKKVECDIIVQILATSPFISAHTIKAFVDTMCNEDLDTLISVKNEKIECVYNKEPINFNQKLISPPSQLVNPVQAYACGLMAWKTSNYIENMSKYSCGYHGGDGKIDFFPIKGNSTIDIDNEEDFQLAEQIARYIANKEVYQPRYADSLEYVEVDVPQILKKDGVEVNDLHSSNSEKPVNVNDIRDHFGDNNSWSKRLVDTENNSATLIHQMPGEGNRSHYHPNWNEWWYIVDGQWEWEIEDKKIVVGKDDIVFIPKGKVHKIKAVGDKPAIRLAVSRADVEHVYPDINIERTLEEHRNKYKTMLREAYKNDPNVLKTQDWANHWKLKLLNEPDDLGWRPEITDVELGKTLRSFFDKNFEGGTILDLGCYDGHYISWFEKASKIICVDIFQESIDYIKNNISTQDQKKEYYVTPGNDLKGVKSESVDFIFCLDSITRITLEDYKSYASEFKRVLKKGGKFFIHIAGDSVEEMVEHIMAQNAPPYLFTKEEILEINDWAKVSMSGEDDIPYPPFWGDYIFGEKKDNFEPKNAQEGE